MYTTVIDEYVICLTMFRITNIQGFLRGNCVYCSGCKTYFRYESDMFWVLLFVKGSLGFDRSVAFYTHTLPKTI